MKNYGRVCQLARDTSHNRIVMDLTFLGRQYQLQRREAGNLKYTDIQVGDAVKTEIFLCVLMCY